jgi:hypothetical protein
MPWHSFLKKVLSVVVAYKASDIKEKSLFLPLLLVAYRTPAPSVSLPSSLQRSIHTRPQNQVKKMDRQQNMSEIERKGTC